MTLERDTILHKRYRILEILGEGGMGAVYKAQDENLGVTVAVKENLFTSEEYSRQFRVEATILASLRHPNLTRVTDHFDEGNGQYLVMDYIEGEDLRDRMDRVGILEEDEVIKIGLAICEALTYLHTRTPTILHRDVKPGNVKISPNGQIYLVDFGLAKIVRGNQMTVTGARAMTPGYSPPEQYGTARTDPRSDVYSLGATLYSALTGALPEDGLARAMNQAELTPIRKHNPKVSRKLSAAIEKSLSVLSEDRYQSSEDFRKALHNARGITRRRLSPEELMVEPPPDIDPNSVAAIEEVVQPNMLTLPPPVSEPVRRSGPPQGAQTPPPLDVGGLLDDSLFDNLPRSKPRRRPLGCGIWVALILLILAGGGAAAYLLYPDLTRQALAFVISPYQTPTITPEATATAAPTATPSPSATPTPTPSPTILVELTPSPTPTSIAVTPRLTTPTITPSPTRTPIPSPTVTGGSLQIAFVSDRTGLPQIWLMNLDGSGLVQLTNIEEGACQPEWSPTGEQLIFISPCAGELEEYPGAGLFIINADGTGITPVIGSRNGDYDPDWSPDGSQIAFTSLRNNNPQVFLLNLDDNTVIAMTDVGFKNFQPAWSNDGTKIAFISGRRGPFQIWLMDPDGQNQIGFSRSASLKDTNPVWSPDDANILFTQRELPNGFPVIVVAPLADNGFSEFRLTTVNSPSRAADYSPDGQWLVFESWPDGLNHDIYLMNLSTLEIIQLTFDASFEFDPAWRPVP